MLLLFENPSGYAIFKVLNNKVLEEENVFKHFANSDSLNEVLKLKHFQKFKDTAEAVTATTKLIEGKIPKPLKKAIKKSIDEGIEEILVADSKLGTSIRDKFNLKCVSNTNVQELMRCIRSQLDSLITELSRKDVTAMTLGLAHSLSRYKLKFSVDKIDTLVIQAVCTLDNIDKELNNFIMRCREWYGWHFPELGRELTDHITYVKVVKIIGTRDNTVNCDLSDILTSETEEKIRKLAETSMGAEVTEDDVFYMRQLCDIIINLTNTKTQLSNYLEARMLALAPNLTILVGTLIAARLISHAGSLINLAKSPASTIQILGAEKSLFRALKTKKATPKHGLIYHTSLIGQASSKNKGKMSRMLAAKIALAVRFDALSVRDDEEKKSFQIGIDFKAKLDQRLKALQDQSLHGIGIKAKEKFAKYHVKSEEKRYPSVLDSTLSKKIKKEENEDDEEAANIIDDKKMVISKTEPDELSVSESVNVKVEDNESLEEPKKKKRKTKHP